MHIENMFQFIVPLIFVAIWALTAIFNREAQPLPPRPGRPPGPRPGGGIGPPRELEPRAEGLTREAPLRWSSPPAAAPAAPGGLTRGRPFGGRDEEILIIRSEPAPPRTPGARSPGGSPSTRRAGRSRPAPSPPPQRSEAARPRGTLGAPLAQNVPLSIAQPAELGPLASPLSALAPEGTIQSVTAAQPTAPAARSSSSPPSQPAIELGLLTVSPARLREAFVLSELLQPPLALRRRTGGQR
jgi:hypothetical protein